MYYKLLELSKRIRRKILQKSELLKVLNAIESDDNLSEDDKYTLYYDILSIQNVDAEIISSIESTKVILRDIMDEALASNMSLNGEILLERLKKYNFRIEGGKVYFWGFNYEKFDDINVSIVTNGTFLINPSFDFFEDDPTFKNKIFRYYTEIDNISSINFFEGGDEIFINLFNPGKCKMLFRELC